MSNYTVLGDDVAFHPGYYVKEIIEDSGLTQEDFAHRLGTTPKNISLLVRGRQNLSIDMAVKLSGMLGNSAGFWLDLQKKYDEKIASYVAEEELKKEREVLPWLDYSWFKVVFDLPEEAAEDERIRQLRRVLSVSSLSVLKDSGLVSEFKETKKISIPDTVRTNAMAQTAVNAAIKTEAQAYNRDRFRKAAVRLFAGDAGLKNLEKLRESYNKSGVVVVLIPEMGNTPVLSMTKKAAGRMVLMISTACRYEEIFRMVVVRETGKILKGELGFSMIEDQGLLVQESSAGYGNLQISEDALTERMTAPLARAAGMETDDLIRILRKKGYLPEGEGILHPLEEKTCTLFKI